jgi:phosphoglycerate dehydrogenase-like enzyme
MKDGCFLIKTARGAIIDESALKHALETEKVARAGLDVFCNEPNVAQWIRESDKIVVQPHMGGLTDVAFGKAERECFENIRALWRDGKPISPVNELSQGKGPRVSLSG